MTEVAGPPPMAFGVLVPPSTGAGAAPMMYSFKAFLEKMKDDRANDIVAELVHFINEMIEEQRDSSSVKRFSDAVHGFMVKMEARIRAHEFFRDAPSSELENTIEGLEKYLMTRLYDLGFSPGGDVDVKRDEEITRRIASLGFLRPKHMDISDEYVQHPIFQTAQTELLKITTFKAPRDKLIVITNCCKILTKLLTVDHTRSPAGADEFLPLLIYTVLKCNPPRLKSHLEYISYFRSPSKLTGESAYFFTNLTSTLQFIENCQADSFSIDAKVFERSRLMYLQRFDSGLSTSTSVLYGEAETGTGSGSGSGSGGGADIVSDESRRRKSRSRTHSGSREVGGRSGSGSGYESDDGDGDGGLSGTRPSASGDNDPAVYLKAALKLCTGTRTDVDLDSRAEIGSGIGTGIDVGIDVVKVSKQWSRGSMFRSKSWDRLRACDVEALLHSHRQLLEYVDVLHGLIERAATAKAGCGTAAGAEVVGEGEGKGQGKEEVGAESETEARHGHEHEHEQEQEMQKEEQDVGLEAGAQPETTTVE